MAVFHEDDDDPVVREIDVFVSETLKDHLYLLQYPVRPAHYSYNTAQPLAARMKPNQQKLELEIGIETDGPFYCQTKGSQLAGSVDHSSESGDFFASDLMDKQVLMSDAAAEPAKRYAIGMLQGNKLHMTPLKGLIQLRPNFSYLDKADKAKASGPGETKEEEVQAVGVRFARTPGDNVKPSRIQTSRQQERQWEEESWVELSYNGADSEISRLERDKLFCPDMETTLSVFNVTPSDYLKSLCPAQSSVDGSAPDSPSNVLSVSQLKGLEFVDQIKALLLNAKVIKFSQICMLLDANSKHAAMLRSLPSFACLVQGCWVVKSELLYPDGSISPTSGVDAEVLRNGRDYVLWKFTQARFVVRKEISSVVKLPFDDLKDILEQVARLRVSQGWEFLGEYDEDFVKRHSDIVTRQQQLWDTRYKKLCEDLGLTKTERPMKGEIRKSVDSGRTKTAESGGDGPKGPKQGGTRRKLKATSEKTQAVGAVKDLGLPLDGCSQSVSDKIGQSVMQAETVECGQPMDTDQAIEMESVMEVGGLAEVLSPMELDYVQQVEVEIDTTPTVQVKTEPLTSSTEETLFASASGMVGGVSSLCVFQSPTRIPAASAALNAASSSALAQFLQSVLGKGVASFRAIRDALLLKQEKCRECDPLNVTIPDVALEKSLHAIGAVEVEYKRKAGNLQALSSSRLFALRSTGESTDKYRHVLLDLFCEGTVWQKKQILQRIADTLGQEPTQREVTKVLKDLCYCKSNKHWHLIGTD